MPYGEYASPALTSVDFQSEKMGELTMMKLIDELHGKGEESAGYSMLDLHLVVRESMVRRELGEAADDAAGSDGRVPKSVTRMPAAQ
ncbi:hypothetical protein [Paraburkholderia sp. 32]|uniref:hypothetical protein n=1 Tax=Paraburkholderia sp. 32 TaxID=2991057 RepID=UPI003D1935FE